jgi:hypothetical protein
VRPGTASVALLHDEPPELLPARWNCRTLWGLDCPVAGPDFFSQLRWRLDPFASSFFLALRLVRRRERPRPAADNRAPAAAAARGYQEYSHRIVRRDGVVCRTRSYLERMAHDVF